MQSYLATYKVGDYVDVKVNSSQQKGMPHYLYHGKTGRVYDVSPHAIGVALNNVLAIESSLKRCISVQSTSLRAVAGRTS
eukprot:gnl/Chilomastix_caulleri/9009.p1 GENE.gnl/Chilomastix_caulleri/9009~~gnl/Chilomastix_caulleri/9009.p1  ORF type:complete len:80 (+),score=11.00 gnl/Chilomastix_caulleri/9009:93-332(+)